MRAFWETTHLRTSRLYGALTCTCWEGLKYFRVGSVIPMHVWRTAKGLPKDSWGSGFRVWVCGTLGSRVQRRETYLDLQSTEHNDLSPTNKRSSLKAIILGTLEVQVEGNSFVVTRAFWWSISTKGHDDKGTESTKLVAHGEALLLAWAGLPIVAKLHSPLVFR